MNFTDRFGYIYVALAAMLWASSGNASKYLFYNGISPFQLVQLRTTIAVITLLLCLAVLRPSLLKISLKDLPIFILLGISLALVQFTYLFAISRIQVAAAILLQYQAPVFIALYVYIVFRRNIDLLTAASIAGAIGGCYLVVGAYSLDILHMNREGIISGLACAIAFAWYSIQSEHCMRRYKPWTILFYALFFASFIWNILYPPFESFNHTYAPGSWFWIFFVGVLGTVLPFGFYNKGISLIKPTHASITATLEPIIAGIIAYALLGETVELLQIIGAVVVVFSIVLLQINKSERL